MKASEAHELAKKASGKQKQDIGSTKEAELYKNVMARIIETATLGGTSLTVSKRKIDMPESFVEALLDDGYTVHEISLSSTSLLCAFIIRW